jgi:hypothetical protein
MKYRIPLLLTSLLLPLTLSSQELGVSVPENLDTSKPAAQLGYDLKIGTQFDTDMKVAQTMEMMGQKVDTTISMGFRMSVKPGGDQGAKKAVVSYTQTGLDMNMMGQKIAYDSADENTDPSNPLAIMGDIIGKEITMVMDEDNQITSIEGVEEMKEELAANPAMAGQLDAFVDEKQLAQMTNDWVTEVLADKPVAPGDSWDFSYSIEASGVGEITYNGKATLHGYSQVDGAEVAVIELDGQIDMDLSNAEGQAAAMGMELTGGDSKSVIYWDNAVGYLRKMEVFQKMNMSMKNPQTGEGMELPISQMIDMQVDVES